MIRRTEFGGLTNEDAEVVVGRVMAPSSLVGLGVVVVVRIVAVVVMVVY